MSKLIAEVGWNHMGDMDLAATMIQAAAESGADYVKFQTWSENRLKPGPWDSDGRRDIYKKAQLTPDNHAFLKERCDEYGVKFLTSCFCPDDLEMIRELTDEVKIASTECNNIPLVSKALDMFNRLFISTGATTAQEYKLWAFYEKVYLLHCVSAYPCPAEQVNLSKLIYISTLTDRFGYSGHYQGIWDAIAAISLGARVVEKHFTTDNSLPGRDNKFAILPHQFKQIRKYVDELPSMLLDHGNDFQGKEKDVRENYAGRWMSS